MVVLTIALQWRADLGRQPEDANVIGLPSLENDSPRAADALKYLRAPTSPLHWRNQDAGDPQYAISARGRLA